MESDSESETEKTYATLENVVNEPTENTTNYQLQFEQFVVAERSDDETEDEEVGEEIDNDEELEQQIETPLIEDILDELDISPSSQECTLKSQEVEVIESCHHEELKNLLFLNRFKNFMLMHLFKKVKDLLIGCRSDIESLTKLSKQFEPDNQNMVLSHLAAPYFKTKKEMFSSEPNKDTLAKRKNGELSIYQNVMSAKWSRNECENLISAVKMTYNHNKQKTLLRKISSLKFKLERERGDQIAALQIIEQIDRLEEEVKDIKEVRVGEVPPVGQDDFIDWEHISSEYLREKHTAFECRAFWHIYLHPDINKTNWEAEENQKIQELVEKYGQQDWDQIAQGLMNNRSGFSVYLHYVSALCEQFSKLRFTKKEDDMILEYVERLKIGSYIPWNAIEAYFPNRSRLQLVHRYKYFLAESNNVVGTFTDAEDILILILVDRFGRTYSKFAPYIPNRAYMQIKNRYDAHLRVCGPKGSFTLEEDQTLMKYMTSQRFKNLGSISQLMNRNRSQLRQRYKTLKAFLGKNPNASLSDAPRRILSNKEASRRFEFLKYISDQFKNHHDVPTIEEIEEKLGVKTKITKKRSKNMENYNIDSLLINFFSNSYKLKQKPIETTTYKIREAAEAVFKILIKWKVKLDIPEELKKNSDLDIIDVEILNSLREKYNQHNLDSSSAVDDLIPPNWNTIIGLRGLLLKNNLYKRAKNRSKVTLMDELPLIRNKSDNHLVSELIDMLKDMNVNTRCRIEIERCFFLERFMSLFMWPAIFSIESPTEQLLNSELGIPNTLANKEKPQPKEIKKRTRTNSISNINSKKREAKKAKLITKQIKQSEIKPVNNKTRMSLRPRKCSTRLKNTTAENFMIDSSAVDSSDSSADELKPDINSERKIIKIIKCNPDGSNKSSGLLNAQNSDAQRQKKATKILKIVKIKKEHDVNNGKEVNEVPTNLRKVEKSEIENMLKNKKPVKMFMIQKIKMKDGTFKTISKPYEGNKFSMFPHQKTQSTSDKSKDVHNKIVTTAKSPMNGEKPVVKKHLLSDNASILDVVSLAESVKKECNVDSQGSIKDDFKNINSKDVVDLEKLNVILKDNIKQYSNKLSSKLSHSNKRIVHKKISPPLKHASKNTKILKIRVMKDKEDIVKLDNILNNVESDEDSIIDLTEREVTKNEVHLLNNFIKSENKFDCF